MDELTRDLLNGMGGLQKIEDGLDGNLAGSLQGAAMQEVARQAEPLPVRAPRPNPVPLRWRALLIAVLLVALLIVWAAGG